MVVGIGNGVINFKNASSSLVAISSMALKVFGLFPESWLLSSLFSIPSMNLLITWMSVFCMTEKILSPGRWSSVSELGVLDSCLFLSFRSMLAIGPWPFVWIDTLVAKCCDCICSPSCPIYLLSGL